MHRHKEKRWSRWVLSLSLCFALVQTGHAQIYTADFMAPYETEALGDGLYAFRIGMRRSLFMVGDEGVIATDPLNVEAAKIFRQEIAKITNKPVK